MYSSSQNDQYKKFSASPPPPSKLPPYGQPTTTAGIPVSSTTQFYTAKTTQESTDIQTIPRGPWSTSLCDCLSDSKNCCVTFWCPCITFGKISEIVDKGSSSCGQNGALYALIACVTCCACCYSCFYRSKMRQQYALRESPCGDCLVHCCCEYCALCQEYRELKTRGLDMEIGWHGNVEKQNQGVAMESLDSTPMASAPVAPVVEAGMTR